MEYVFKAVPCKLLSGGGGYLAPENVENKLNEMSKEGWEYVNSLPVGESQAILVFRRRK